MSAIESCRYRLTTSSPLSFGMSPCPVLGGVTIPSVICWHVEEEIEKEQSEWEEFD